MSNFPLGKRQELQESLGTSTSTRYICPICARPFMQELRLWSHGKEFHSNNLGSLLTQEAEEQVRKSWELKAEHRAEEKAAAQKAPIAGKRGRPGSKRSAKASPSPERSSTTLGTSEGTLLGSTGATHFDVGRNRAMSDNPFKRGAGPASASSDRPTRQARSPGPNADITHAPSRSTGQQPIEKDFNHLRTLRTDLSPAQGPTTPFHDYQAEEDASAKPPVDYQSRRGIIATKNLNITSPQLVQDESLKDSRQLFRGHSGAKDRAQHISRPSPSGNKKPSAPLIQDRSATAKGLDAQDEIEPDTSMLRQPETRPISHDQLVVEVKGIYAGLVMVEAKCIEVDERQKIWAQNKDYAKSNLVTPDQWKSLIALHKQLLHEHHDFFLASQHPSASNNLSRLAAKYIMPARMWRHGIHGFLEVLRHRLPESLEHMLTFIYIAYNMMALLFETVPSFEDTWIECLGDLGRYRMAIEDDEPRDREIWSNVARYWYSKASDKSPITGRLYHHLAILARPNTLEHLSLYTKSLTCIVPFDSAKGSILTLLNPILSGKVSVSTRNLQIEIFFIKAHAILFTQRHQQFSEVLQLARSNVVHDFLYHKDDKGRNDNIGRSKKIFAYLATANVSAILEYGATVENGTPRSSIRREHDAMNVREGEDFSQKEEEAPGDTFMQNSHDTINISELSRMGYQSAPLSRREQEQSSTTLHHASELAFSTLNYTVSDLHWSRDGRVWKHLLPFNHIMLVFIWGCCEAGTSINVIERFVPWAALCSYLNTLMAHLDKSYTDINASKAPFDKAGADNRRPLWEDFLLRGLTYTLWYFPKNWFSESGLDDEERQLELASMDGARIARILCLGRRIASRGKWFSFNTETKSFRPAREVTEPAYTECRMKMPHNWEKTDEDSIMSDVSLLEGGLRNTAPSDTDISSTSSPPTTLNDPTDRSVDAEATENALTPKVTPKAIAADEPEDIPMVDLSPTKEVPPTMDEKPLSLEQVPSSNALDMVTSKMQETSDIMQMADDSKIE